MIAAPVAGPSALTGESRFRTILPGLLLSMFAAAVGSAVAVLARPIFPVPAMVFSLFFGIALHGVGSKPIYRPGIEFCVRTVLRCGVALLGFRTDVADILALGVSTLWIVLGSMAVTIGSGFL